MKIHQNQNLKFNKRHEFYFYQTFKLNKSQQNLIQNLIILSQHQNPVIIISSFAVDISTTPLIF